MTAMTAHAESDQNMEDIWGEREREMLGYDLDTIWWTDRWKDKFMMDGQVEGQVYDRLNVWFSLWVFFSKFSTFTTRINKKDALLNS